MCNIMDTKKRRELDSQILGCIDNLCTLSAFTEKECKDITAQLLNVYKYEDYRHHYSEFSLRIDSKCKDKDTEFPFADLENNLYLFNEHIKTKQFDVNETKMLFKFLDHMNIELGRRNEIQKNIDSIKDHDKKLEEIKKETESVNESLKTATKNSEDTQTQMETAQKQMDETQKQLKDMQTQLVGILSIFAAIVITMAGGINVISGALSSLGEVSVVKASLFFMFAAFAMFNTVFVLLYLTGKIIGRNFYSTCKSEQCTCTKPKSNRKGQIIQVPECNAYTRVKRRLPYIFYINMIFIGLMVLAVVIIVLLAAVSVDWDIKSFVDLMWR